jgi:hypothetical protein
MPAFRSAPIRIADGGWLRANGRLSQRYLVSLFIEEH